MKIKSISIAETDSYNKEKFGDYKAQVRVARDSSYGEASINIGLTMEQMAVIVPIIAQAVSNNMDDMANKFSESVQASLTPPIEQVALPS